MRAAPCRPFNARLIGFSVLLATGCVAPTTHLGTVSPEMVRAEQLKQQQLVLQSEFAEQQRLLDVAQPMLVAAVPLCGKWVTTRLGIRAVNIHSFGKEYREAASALGFNDTLSIVNVTRGSAADRAGFKVGDRVVNLNREPAPTGKNAVAAFGSFLSPSPVRRGEPALATEPYRLTVRRMAETTATHALDVAVAADTVCAYAPVALKDDALNAWADGQRVVVTTAMLRFAGTDEELAGIVAHEIAHNAMRHIDAKKKNATVGAIFGAILDVAAATQGVNTGGDFTNQGAAIGAMSYSQDFEREADYVGMYILARAGRPFANAPNLWRRMAQESPGSIKYASTHPTSAERFVRLEKIVAEIQGKQSRGESLLPDTKNAQKP
ncbi:MAG TPA: M48 family metallopeptidase [Gemmatimonadaceae bacterium]|nr:M48 family metallopeptidase [Gemmatimonadaceae bacterium]